LHAHFGDRLRVFTKTELIDYDYFLRPAPDLYRRLKTNSVTTRYLVDIVDPSQPLFVALNRIKKYLNYAESGEWEEATGNTLPEVFIICDPPVQQIKLTKLVTRLINNLDTDAVQLTLISLAEVVDPLAFAESKNDIL
jgi:hypothetical protein